METTSVSAFAENLDVLRQLKAKGIPTGSSLRNVLNFFPNSSV